MTENIVAFPIRTLRAPIGHGAELPQDDEPAMATKPSYLVAALHYLSREAEASGYSLAAHLITTAAQSVREESDTAKLTLPKSRG